MMAVSTEKITACVAGLIALLLVCGAVIAVTASRLVPMWYVVLTGAAVGGFLGLIRPLGPCHRH